MTPSHPPLKESFCETPSGRIHYVEAGDGPALLLLHSNGCSLHEFASVMEGLSQHHRCIAWDMPGHGDSDNPQGHQSIEDYADAVLAFMDVLGLDKAHVCGASVGGFIAIALAVAAPSRMAGVVIAEAALRSEADWAGQWLRIESMFAIPTQTHEAVAPRFRAFDADLLTRWNIDRHKAGGWRMVDVMWAIREYKAADQLHLLSQSGVPAVVLMGDRGPVIACRSDYEALLPDAAIQVVDNAGHFPMIDDPQAFVSALQAGMAEATSAAS